LPWGQTCWNQPGKTCDYQYGSFDDISNAMTTSMSGIPCQPWSKFPTYAQYDYNANQANLCVLNNAAEPAPWCYINAYVGSNSLETGTREACMIPCTREYQRIYFNSE
jgi:hypothetical protein